jgi:hypothetical protein
MYYPFIEAIAMTLVDIPITFITISCYTVTIYFLVQLQQTAGQFLCVSFLNLFYEANSSGQHISPVHFNGCIDYEGFLPPAGRGFRV